MNGTSKVILIITLLVLAIYFINNYKKGHPMTKRRSDIDDSMYVVRDLPDKQQASNLLARLKKNIFTISDHLIKNIDKYPEMKDYINQLSRNIIHMDISETDGTSEHTSYSVNKGEEMVFCLRSKQMPTTDKMHELNLLMYVTLHEMAHVGCPEYGHTELFNKIFAFLATTASSMNLYKIVAYDINPHEYCGLIISSSIV